MARNTAALLAILTCAVASWVSTPAAAGAAGPSRQKEDEARALAQQMLTGSKVVVRIYDNRQTDPQIYRTVSVTLTGLTISFDAVKKAHAASDESSIIVVTAKDQPDEAVAAVIGDFVHVDNYKPGKGLNIWPSWSYVPNYQYWVFTDALGDPIPNAEVEIVLHNQFYYSQRLPLEKTVLDGKGRLRPFAVKNTFYRFLFVVSHPQYGKAITERFAPDGQDDGHRIVPLVPKGSEGAARSIQGYVVDSEGYGLEDIPVACWVLETPQSSGLNLPRGAGDRLASVTDEHGWFALYMPAEKDGVLCKDLIPADSKLTLAIIPPKSLNMHEHHEPRAVPGSQVLITLASMNPDKHFHTFTFEDDRGVITDPQELKAISVTLMRDDGVREWRRLTYDQWKDGCRLQKGQLRAETRRWNQQFRFKPIELNAESPKELIFRSGEPIIYKGAVVEGRTGKPMPGVLVLVKDSYPPGGLSLTNEQLESFRAKALAGDVTDPSRRGLYEHDERVALTDANGRYQFVFLTGLREDLGSFIAFEDGYVAEEPVRHQRLMQDTDRMIELPPIRMLPLETKYMPALIFEDQSGAIITDPNVLEKIELEIERDEGIGRRTWLRSYGSLIESNETIRGTYRATLDWQGRRYTYKPVEIDWGGPDRIIFTVEQVSPLGVTCLGRVIHGITGAPIPGAIVMSRSRPSNTDASAIQPEQWEAIHLIGPQPDPEYPALIPLREAFAFDQVTRADQTGQFQIHLQRTGHSRLLSLTAVQQGYLGAQQFLSYLWPETNESSRVFGNQGSESGAEGRVRVPPMKLFPAATVAIEPVLSDVGGVKSRVRFYMHTSPDDPAPWLKDFRATPNVNGGACVLLKYDLKQNDYQNVSVLAGVNLVLKIVPASSGKAPVAVRGVKLEQGQLLDLGRVEFPEAFLVTLKVADPAGEPVEGVRVGCVDADGFFWAFNGRRPPVPITDAQGEAVLYVPANSKGELVATHHDGGSGKAFREGVPYKVGGADKDAGRMFTLQLSEQMYRRLIDANLHGEGRP